jgi:flagellar L-ring protein precursor FlgH
MASNTKVERSKELTGEVSCLVTDVMPNGNLVIQGDRYLTSGTEKMKITFSGVVRPMDIAHNNTVPSSRVANAEVVVGGKGIISRTQRPGLINNILQAIF